MQTNRPNKQPLFTRHEPAPVDFPIQSVSINWDRLIAKRPVVLNTTEGMLGYLLKPEVIALLAEEKDPRIALIIDLMWGTGARVSEVLALTPTSFIDDGFDFGVTLKTLNKSPGRPSKLALQRSPKRYIPIKDVELQRRIQSYLWAGRFRKTEVRPAKVLDLATSHVTN